ncbi:MAG: ancA 3 [Bacteroidota bacterium]|jgi:hypothetical protein|nr:ancA 3 [Bacteroidota bacterium]
MKKSILFFCILLSNFSFSQSWLTVGTADFADDYATFMFSAISPNGEPYVVYRDYSLVVKKFDDFNWVNVGPPFSIGMVSCTTMDFDTEGNPYVAYTDWANNKKASVMKFDGTNWVAVGSLGFTPNAATYTSIKIDNNGTPYVAFRDVFHNYRASVMKFDGSNWVYVGAPGFSAHGNGYQGASYTSLFIDPDGFPYVAYTEMSNNFSATVMRFDGNNWIYVGDSTGFSAGPANNTSIVADSQGTIYVAYVDGATGEKATVKKFDGNNWVSVGIPGFSPGAVSFTSLAINNNDVLYVAFKDHANSNKASVMTFNGSNWVILGQPGFSACDVNHTTIAVDKNNGILYTAYVDLHNASSLTPSYDATVMRFDISTSIKDAPATFSITVYPNPTSRLVTIYINSNTSQENLALRINNSLGKTVFSETLKENSEPLTKQIDLGALPKGIYFIELQVMSSTSKNKSPGQVTKLILQ